MTAPTPRAVPLRVLWLVKGLGPGGAERLLVSLARAHDRRVVALEVAYVLSGKDHLVAELAGAGVRVHPLGVDRDLDPRWVPRLRRLLRDGGYDVVHLHSPMVAAVARLVARSLPRRQRPLLVSTEHNAWRTYALPTRVLNALTWGLDDAHLAVSQEAASSVWPAARRRRVEVVVHGTELDRLRAARARREHVRAELGVAPDDVVVVTVANYRAQKNYGDLLAAARAVVDRGLPVRFVAVGQGPLEDDVRRRHAELLLGDRFTLLGYRDDVPDVLAAADVFALASSYEGYPVALMEALAAGLPVVATAVGGVTDAVHDAVEGRLVPPGRPDLLAGALAEVVADPDLRARLAAAATRRGDDFDIRAAARRIEQVYVDATQAP